MAKKAVKSSEDYPIPQEVLYQIGEEEQISLLDPALPAAVANRAELPPTRYQLSRAVEKVRGAVYTPPRIASALTRWAIRSAHDRVLDPACGEGVFLCAAQTRLADLGARKPVCIGVDIDPGTAAVSGACCDDFFRWARSAAKVDVILGNPPFIRSHLFPEDSRLRAFAAMVRMGLKPSRLMSTWAPFLALSCGLLNPNGRLAMVIPEELLAVGYAEDLRRFLLRRFRRVIVCLPNGGVFSEVQQAVVLLLCDNEQGGLQGLLTIDFPSLERGDFLSLEPAQPWQWTTKWSHLFLTVAERTLVNDWKEQMTWRTFSEYGRVEVGVVTGDNSFFLINMDKAPQFSERSLMPIIASTKDLRGIKFGTDDFRRVLAQNRPSYVLNVSEPIDMLPAALRSYIREGEQRRISERYKCRIRSPWYAVPSLWTCDAVLFRQSCEMPRVVHLAKKCTATDTIHRVTWLSPSLGRRHSASFMNTWTLLNAELLGRSYGGGVLELMPSEANHLPLPQPTNDLDSVFHSVDDHVRARRFCEAVDLVDRVVMPHWTNRGRLDAARKTLSKLVQRRLSRGNADY